MSDYKWRQDAKCGSLFLLTAAESRGKTQAEIEVANTRKVHELFFPAKGDIDGGREAVRVCLEECPVQRQCLKDALENEEKVGIWGGTSGRTRRRISRMRYIVGLSRTLSSEVLESEEDDGC